MTRRILPAITALPLAAGLVLAAAAPPEETQGDLGRLLFVHVPSVIAAYAALATGMGAALFYIIRRTPAADRVSASAVEIGTVFTGLTLLTGMIWGRPSMRVCACMHMRVCECVCVRARIKGKDQWDHTLFWS